MSYWFAFLESVLTRNLKVDGYKFRRIVDIKMPELEDASYNIMQLVGIGKGNGVGLITSDEEGVWLELIDHHDLSVEGVEDLVIAQAASKVLAWSNKDFASIDFDDMMYMSLKLILERGFQPDVGPCVLVDECQDLNPLQATLLPYMGQRVIGVGDAYQAIFGFRGAGIGAMDYLQEKFDMVSLPMQTTRRVPKTGVTYAQNFCPTIKAAPDAIDGYLGYIDEGEIYHTLKSDDLVLCRMNAPLFTIALKLIRDNVRFEMSGKLPKQLVRWIHKFKAASSTNLIQKIEIWWKTEEERLKAAKKHKTIEREYDKVCTMRIICERYDTVADITQMLDQISDKNGGVRLTTIHGAKGLEAHTVYWLKPGLCDGSRCTMDWEFEQEKNMQFVAATRHKHTLYLVS